MPVAPSRPRLVAAAEQRQRRVRAQFASFTSAKILALLGQKYLVAPRWPRHVAAAEHSREFALNFLALLVLKYLAAPRLPRHVAAAAQRQPRVRARPLAPLERRAQRLLPPARCVREAPAAAASVIGGGRSRCARRSSGARGRARTGVGRSRERGTLGSCVSIWTFVPVKSKVKQLLPLPLFRGAAGT